MDPFADDCCDGDQLPEEKPSLQQAMNDFRNEGTKPETQFQFSKFIDDLQAM